MDGGTETDEGGKRLLVRLPNLADETVRERRVLGLGGGRGALETERTTLL